MIKFKKVKSVALSFALMMSLLAGCTNKSVTQESVSETAADTTVADTSEADAKEETSTANAENDTEAATEETSEVSTADEETDTDAETTADDETMAGETDEVIKETVFDETSGSEAETSTDGFEETSEETTVEATETTEEATETTEEAVETTEVPEETTAPEPFRFDQTLDVRIVNWYQGEEEAPKTPYDKAYKAYLEKIQQDHNFTVRIENIGGWGESYTTQLSASISAGDPIGQVCILDSSWAAGIMNNNFCEPLDTLRSLDLTEPKWNRGVSDAMTYGGHVYGMAIKNGGRTRAGVYFNKRLLQEAGYCAEELYDFQKNGMWTWSKFEEVLAACTRDTDHDGITDVWGMTGFNMDFYTIAIYSSGADFVTKDATGKFVNRMNTASFQDALTWANRIWNTYGQPQPEGSEWDYFKTIFCNGEAAMRVAEEYVASELEIEGMADEWGFVMFPCPDGQEPITIEREEVAFIPSSYSTAEADNIAYVYDLFTDPVPGYEDSDVWKEEFLEYYPNREVVDETLARMRFGKVKERLDLYVYGFDETIGPGFIWELAGGTLTPAGAIESKQGEWNTCIKEQNNALKKLGR